MKCEAESRERQPHQLRQARFVEFQRVKMRCGDSPSDLKVWMGVTQVQQPTQQPVATIRRRVLSEIQTSSKGNNEEEEVVRQLLQHCDD